MSAELDLKRFRTDANRLRNQIANQSKIVADKRSKAATARSAAMKSKSASQITSKNREAERAEKEANRAEKEISQLNVKLAAVERKISDAQTRYEKEQQAKYKKAFEQMRLRNEDAARQFSWPLPLREKSLSELSSLTRIDPEYDIFLSHASEDKEEVARPLKNALEERGLSVWFDEINIKIGQSIRLEIERGINNARFGVVIVSESFFAKQWTQAELDALFSKKMQNGENLILPVWHRVTKDQVQSMSMLLAGVNAANTSLSTIEEIADQLRDVVRV